VDAHAQRRPCLAASRGRQNHPRSFDTRRRDEYAESWDTELFRDDDHRPAGAQYWSEVRRRSADGGERWNASPQRSALLPVPRPFAEGDWR
jgi:hypothetical protein